MGPPVSSAARPKPGTCDVQKLKNFLTAPENSAKAQEWARVLRITTEEIPGYIDRLTPVVLRHDTLVTNHDYEDGKAVPYAALLQAGIAILVDQQGLPAVKCSCGNPLLPFEGDAAKTKVQFTDGNKKWADFRQDHVVVVKPPPGQQDIRRLQLVDVRNPDRGIARPLGTEGKDDTSFNTHEKHTVPAVTGMVFAQAAQSLADEGLAMAYDGGALPSDDAPVIASQPAAGQRGRMGHARDPERAGRQPVRQRRRCGLAVGIRWSDHGWPRRLELGPGRVELGPRDHCADSVRRLVRPFVRPLVLGRRHRNTHDARFERRH